MVARARLRDLVAKRSALARLGCRPKDDAPPHRDRAPRRRTRPDDRTAHQREGVKPTGSPDPARPMRNAPRTPRRAGGVLGSPKTPQPATRSTDRTGRRSRSAKTAFAVNRAFRARGKPT